MSHTTKQTPALVPSSLSESFMGVASIGRASLEGAYATLMALTTDAVFVFDGGCQILGLNAQAERLSGFGADELVGKDIRSILFNPNRTDEDETLAVASELDTSKPYTGTRLLRRSGSPDDIPFPVDGSLAILSLHLAKGGATQVALRADRVSAPGVTYLATLRAFEPASEMEREHDRLVDELALANRRLSGTLKIVLDTIDVADVESLFTEVLEQIAETLDAHGAVLFIAETTGYRLHAATHTLEGRALPQYMAFGEGLETVVARAGASLRLRLVPPREKNLRGGALTQRELLDEETSKTYIIPARQAPPFASLLCVPIWFAGHVIAIIEVGWNEQRSIRRDDARLMDSVAQYLSVEFAAALSTMRTERAQRLDAMATRLHTRLESDARVNKGDLSLVANALAKDLGVTISPIRAGVRGQVSIINLPGAAEHPLDLDVIGAAPVEVEARAGVPIGDAPTSTAATGASAGEAPKGTPAGRAPSGDTRVLGAPVGGVAFPFNLDELVQGKSDQGIAVVPISSSPQLSSWLTSQGCSASGVIFDLGTIAGMRRASLLLRSEDKEPIDDTDLDFLRRIAIDIHETAQERLEREKDTHISQALQSGMKNELQKVDGIFAEGLYSSATAAALVGGDFYDLIALPKHRACVILGDVSGKGVEAASVSAAVKTALGAYAWEGQTPARMVRLLNDFLLGFSRLETFATLFVGMIDLVHAQLTYCSAGHPPAIFLHADTQEMQTLDEQSGVVGAFKGMTYHDGHLNIKTGDALLLYTDGVTEARNPSGAFFAETGLADAVMEEADSGIEGITSRLLARLDAFTERSLEDDVAMVALRFDKVGKAK